MSLNDNANENIILKVNHFSLWYGEHQALFDISLNIKKNAVTSFIGPSGCGKSTLLRSLNRLNDLIEKVRIKGDVLLNHDSVYDSKVDPTSLRKRVGMIFQKSNPFPMSIYENVVYPLRIAGETSRQVLDEAVERSLTQAALWEEVKDRLKKSALELSGGQQQRLCIARAIALQPEILLMDEPCSALDPIATEKIEVLMTQMKKEYTIIIVTHSMSQAKRVSQDTAFFYMGHLIEAGPTEQIFGNAKRKETQDYVSGRFG